MPLPAVLIAHLQLAPTLLRSVVPAAAQKIWLYADEREKLGTYRQPADRWRMLAGRFIVRSCLREHFHIAETQFSYGAHGKPYLARDNAPQTLDFNLSHDRGDIIAAFSTACEVGIDIANLADFEDWEAYATDFMTRSELVATMSQHPTERPAIAARLWTAKEAILKATGHGLDIDPREIEIDLEGPSPHLYLPDSLPASKTISLQEWRPGSHTRACLAIVWIDGCHNESRGAIAIQYRTIPVEKMLTACLEEIA